MFFSCSFVRSLVKYTNASTNINIVKQDSINLICFLIRNKLRLNYIPSASIIFVCIVELDDNKINERQKSGRNILGRRRSRRRR